MAFQLFFSNKYAPPWMSGESYNLAFLEGLKSADIIDQAEIIAYALDQNGVKHILASKSKNGIQFNFNIDKTILKIQEEQYEGAKLDHGFVSRLPFDYNKFPTWFIGLMSKVLTKKIDLKKLPNFPQYPLDISVDVLAYLSDIPKFSEKSNYPKGKKYAVVFTHDVDTSWVFENEKWLQEFRAAEEDFGVRSAWYIVPLNINTEQIKKHLVHLDQSGHELGVHGLDHSPALPFLPIKELTEKLQRSYDILSEFTAKGIGYRAPWLARNEQMFKVLKDIGYLYDSSVPNSDFNGGNVNSNNGCCTVFPFERAGLPIIPITIPLDGISFPLGMKPIEFYDWVLELVGQIKQMGGVVVITTHTTPHYSANAEMMKGYRYIVEQLSQDHEAWHCLPRELVQWTNTAVV